ncbi:hypothetical protein HRI_004038000 [Hibiscus trionum]|uniref:Uncharacterized protein n=1 Tax=Hibiscus trionum TaxID=183268 RepID=A0A9W7IZG6_HIBTR|nr:hypothetical protein HRI_004038000 [Hibiscus trionum]
MPALQMLNIIYCQEFMTMSLAWESLPDLNEVDLFDVPLALIQKICRSKGMDQQTITSMVLSRQEGIDAIFKITRWSKESLRHK